MGLIQSTRFNLLTHTFEISINNYIYIVYNFIRLYLIVKSNSTNIQMHTLNKLKSTSFHNFQNFQPLFAQILYRPQNPCTWRDGYFDQRA